MNFSLIASIITTNSRIQGQGFTIKWLQGGLGNRDIMTDFLQPSSSEISQFIMLYKGKAALSTNHRMITTEGRPTNTVTWNVRKLPTWHNVSTGHLENPAYLNESPVPELEEL